MGLTRARNDSESGVALFMVIAAIAVLAVLVTEFTYVAQVNQKIAFDGLDQLKAHYLAKSGLKLSLLRLKAYQNVKGVASSVAGGGGGGGAVPGLPKSILEKIWSFPFMYPIPTNVPGMTAMDKERIESFQKSSGLEGRYSASIQSESSKYNLNMLLAPFAPTGATGPTAPTGPAGQPQAPKAPTGPAFDPQAARNSLGEYLYQILVNKTEADPEFAADYRDFKIEELVDSISGWADLTYERRSSGNRDVYPQKRGPFYSLSELHMLPEMDDRLYDLFAPALTVSVTPGINVNTMNETTLRALVPQITDEEAKEFFKYRDSEEEDNQFKDSESFFKWILGNVAAFRGDQAELTRFKESLTKRNIRIVVDETEFKITVLAQVNQSTRLIEAWVTLGKQDKKATSTTGASPSPTATPAPGGSGTSERPDPGLRITFMRIL